MPVEKSRPIKTDRFRGRCGTLSVNM